MFSMQFCGSQQPGGADFEIIFIVEGKRYDLRCDTEGQLALFEKKEMKDERSTSVSWIKTLPTQDDVLRLLPQEQQWTWEKLMIAKEYWLQGYDIAARGYVESELRQIEKVRRFYSFYSRSSAWGDFARGLFGRLQRQLAR
ncbi:MAG: hypothetical protein K8Q97_04165 [Candidatus Andersenbacteria bacterium]|nr:hypothetical protein [Candidatus Andersenbacteria bacterium]